jgi:hypothetical protein
MWMLGPVTVSITALSASPWIWSLSQSQSSPGIPGHLLEVSFLAAAGMIVLGALGWIVQALDGVRLGSRLLEEPKKKSVGNERTNRRDMFGLALAGVVVAFALTFSPIPAAQEFDDRAMSLNTAGLQIIPLCMTWTAMKLDPSQPVYAAHAAQMYASLGNEEAAARLLRDLRLRWKRVGNVLTQGMSAQTHPAPQVEGMEESGGRSAGAAELTASSRSENKLTTPKSELRQVRQGSERHAEAVTAEVASEGTAQ